MSYMLLIVEQPGERDVDAAEGQRRYEVMHAFAAGLDSRGLLTSAESLLTPDETGVRVRRRGGKNATVDGPFAEAKEIIGGLFIIQAADYDQAVEICRSCPHLDNGWIELRQIDEV